MPEARSRRSSTARDSSASAASIGAASSDSAEAGTREAQREHQPDEPLLGAVMEVAFELLALTVRCGDEPSL